MPSFRPAADLENSSSYSASVNCSLLYPRKLQTNNELTANMDCATRALLFLLFLSFSLGRPNVIINDREGINMIIMMSILDLLGPFNVLALSNLAGQREFVRSLARSVRHFRISAQSWAKADRCATQCRHRPEWKVPHCSTI